MTEPIFAPAPSLWLLAFPLDPCELAPSGARYPLLGWLLDGGSGPPVVVGEDGRAVLLDTGRFYACKVTADAAELAAWVREVEPLYRMDVATARGDLLHQIETAGHVLDLDGYPATFRAAAAELVAEGVAYWQDEEKTRPAHGGGPQRVRAAKAGILQLFEGDEGLRLRTPEVMMLLDLTRPVVYDAWQELVAEGRVVREEAEGVPDGARYQLAAHRDGGGDAR